MTRHSMSRGFERPPRVRGLVSCFLLDLILTTRPIDELSGFGTDEATIIAVVSPLSALQMNALARTFEAQVGRSLVATFEKETRSWFMEALRGLALGPLGFDCWLVNRACKGLGKRLFLSPEYQHR